MTSRFEEQKEAVILFAIFETKKCKPACIKTDQKLCILAKYANIFGFLAHRAIIKILVKTNKSAKRNLYLEKLRFW